MYLALHSSQTGQTRAFGAALRATGIGNIFNPSFHRTAAGTTIAFRGFGPDGEKPFHAYILHLDAQGAARGPAVSLTEHYAAQLGYPVCDPKLFEMDGACWVTFNTGHFQTPNEIYVAPVTPQIGPALRVVLSPRGEIEKNWGFFAQGGVLHAIYGLSPLVILRETHRTGQEIHMEVSQSAAPAQGLGSHPSLTIGTQPVALPGPGPRLALVAHKRRYFRGKRMYTGRPVVVDLDSGQVHVGRVPWFHSLRALLGDRITHNPNLLSCSYFAGLAIEGDRVLVSYGINDVDFGIAELPLAQMQALGAGDAKRHR